MNDIHDYNLIMNEVIKLQFFNELKFSLKTYLIIFSKKIRSNNKLFTFKELLNNLKNEKSRITQNDKIINYVNNKNQNRGFCNFNLESLEKKSDESKSKVENQENKNFGYRCDKSDHNANNCKHKKAMCHNCNKTDYLRNNCRNKVKKNQKSM